MLLLPVYALGYLGLIFSWVLLAPGFLPWCRRSHSTKASRLCCVLALLEDKEQAVRLRVRLRVRLQSGHLGSFSRH